MMPPFLLLRVSSRPPAGGFFDGRSMEILKQEVRLINTVLTWQDRPGGRTLKQALSEKLEKIEPGVQLIINCDQVGSIELTREERNSDKNLEGLLNALKTNAAKNPFCLVEVSDYERWSRIASRLRMTVISWRGDQCKLVGRRIPEINDPVRLKHRVFFKIVSEHSTLLVSAFRSLGVDEVQIVEELVTLMDIGLVVPIFPEGWTLVETNVLLYIFKREKALDMKEMGQLFGVEMGQRVLDKLGVRNPNNNYRYRNKKVRQILGFTVVRP
jgi:hypothetical protein